MATKHIRRARFFGDDRRIVALPISTPTSAIEVGDFVYWTGTAAISFTDISDQGTKAQNQAYAKAGFAGVAVTRVAAGTTSGNVQVATGGVFEGACTSGTYKVGDLVGAEGTGTASAVGVSPTTVAAVATTALALARVAKAGTTVTTLQYEIMGTLTIIPAAGTSAATDTIAESTPGAGVTVDSVLLKDGNITCTDAGVGGDLTVDGTATFGSTLAVDSLIESTSGVGVAIDGTLVQDGLFITKQAAPTAETGVATISIADILTGIVTLSHTAGATVALTLDTGSAMDTGRPGGMGTDVAIDWSLINLSAAALDTGTLTASSGHTIVGNPIVQSAHSSTGGIYGNSARFRSRRTATNTWITYRIG